MKDELLKVNRLRELRKDLGITQEELGQAVGVTANAIGHYENGLREPRLEIAKKLADYFSTDIETIFNL